MLNIKIDGCFDLFVVGIVILRYVSDLYPTPHILWGTSGVHLYISIDIVHDILVDNSLQVINYDCNFILIEMVSQC